MAQKNKDLDYFDMVSDDVNFFKNKKKKKIRNKMLNEDIYDLERYEEEYNEFV